jgi:benzylsuccinate CoA-transferase BbsE subunit
MFNGIKYIQNAFTATDVTSSGRLGVGAPKAAMAYTKGFNEGKTLGAGAERLYRPAGSSPPQPKTGEDRIYMETPFGGVTILDLTHDLGRYAGRLFADLGADVIRIEPPEGLADRIGQACAPDTRPAFYEFEFLNASKQSRVIDVNSAEGRAKFAELMKSSQVVLLERGGPLFGELEWLQSLSPTTVITSVSPFGRTGPWRDAPSSDLVLQAAGGIAWLSGHLDGPPLRLPGQQATMITGVYAAVATAIALYDAMATGRGHVVDVSTQECIAHSLQNSIQVYDFEHRVSMRGGEGTRDASEDMFACKDGLVFLAATLSLGVSWKALVEWVRESEHPALEELSKNRWNDRTWRMTSEAKRILRETLESFFMDYTKEELTQEAVKRKVVLAPVSGVLDVLDDPQLRHRQYFQAVKLAGATESVAFPGAPYRFSEPVWSVAPAPSVGQSRAFLTGETL